jgi:excisionase family DNA binding protein
LFVPFCTSTLNLGEITALNDTYLHLRILNDTKIVSSNIRIQRICEYCNKEFEARKTTSKTCSDHCAKMNYKAKQRASKIEKSNTETIQIITKPIEVIKAKEFLTVRDLSKLLNCSIRTAYNIIERGDIKAVKVSDRKTLIKRSEVDKLFA